MEKRQIGATGIEVTVLTLGTWPMGAEDYWGPYNDDSSLRTIARALELGINCIDTASVYGSGHAEEVVGKALAGRRQDVILATKIWPRKNTRPEILADLEASLQRLRTDYIDVYFIHYANYDVPIAETMATLEELRRQGRIRAIGVSNFPVPVMERARQFGAIDVAQPPYNLIWRYIEADIRPYCLKHNIGIFTYASLAQGILAGRLRLGDRFEGPRRDKSALFAPKNYSRCLHMVDQLRPIAARLGVTLAQLALNWLVSQPGVTVALLGACTPAEIEEDMGALGWTLSAADLADVMAVADPFFRSLPLYEMMWSTDLMPAEPKVQM